MTPFVWPMQCSSPPCYMNHKYKSKYVCIKDVQNSIWWDVDESAYWWSTAAGNFPNGNPKTLSTDVRYNTCVDYAVHQQLEVWQYSEQDHQCGEYDGWLEFATNPLLNTHYNYVWSDFEHPRRIFINQHADYPDCRYGADGTWANGQTVRNQVMSSMMGVVFGIGRFDVPWQSMDLSVMNEDTFGHVSVAQGIDRTWLYCLMNAANC